MPVPSWQDLVTLTSTANGLQAESLESRLMTVLAMLAAGQAPDGTAVTIGAGGATWGPANQGLITWAYDPATNLVAGSALIAGSMVLIQMVIPATTTVHNIIMTVMTAGAGLTAGQCFACLYQNNTLLGATADQSAVWTSAGTTTMALTSPVTVTAGTVYAGAWFNGTTSPLFARGSASSADNIGLPSTNPRFAAGPVGLTTTAPATLPTLSPAAAAVWAALS